MRVAGSSAMRRMGAARFLCSSVSQFSGVQYLETMELREPQVVPAGHLGFHFGGAIPGQRARRATETAFLCEVASHWLYSPALLRGPGNLALRPTSAHASSSSARSSALACTGGTGIGTVSNRVGKFTGR